MNKENAETRKKLRQINTVAEFASLLDKIMLSAEEKRIVELHYKEDKSLSFIADELGMSEANVKKKHCKILKKIGKMF